MQKYSEVVLDKNGKGIAGATITVTTYPNATPATIYAADGGPAVTSVTTDSAGRFAFYAANGHYSITVSGQGITPYTYNDVTLFDSDDLSDQLAGSDGAYKIGYGIVSAGAQLDILTNELRSTVINAATYGLNESNSAAQNDAAFASACSAIMALGGGRLVVPPGVYQVCHQKQGVGGAFGNTDAIVIHNCTRPVVIEGYGAKLVMPDGQRWGSFDPVTGNAYTPPSLPFWNNAYAGHPGRFIYLYQNVSVAVHGFELDGNCIKYIVGGEYGDTGRQTIGNGIELDGNWRASIRDVHVHHCGLDGVDLKWDGLAEGSPSNPVMLVNIRSEYNARQAMSHEGGIGLTAIGCKFNHTGRAVNINTGINMYSSPGAGIDIEPIGSTVSRNLAFYSCESVNNVGYALASDIGNAASIAFHDFTFWGTTNYAIKPTHPYTEFHHCRVIGRWIGPYAADPQGATKFFNVTFSDTPWQDGNVAGKNDGGYLINTGPAKGVLYRDCSITTTYQKLGDMRDSTLERCVFKHAYGGLADKSDILDLRGAILRDVQIIDAVASPTANGYYVQVDNTQNVSGRCEITYTGAAGKLKWASWDSAAGGFQGIFGLQADPLMLAARYLVMHKNFGTNNATANMFVFSGTAPPTFGTWEAGCRCLNSAPAVGQPKGWICTVAGSPGTWVSEGNL